MIVRRLFAIAFFISALTFGFVSSYKMIGFKNQSSSLLNSFDGAYTCFHRVLQTYSAKAASLDNFHVSSKFIDNTENCLNDLKKVSANLGIEDLDLLVTSLIDKVYWFHRSEDMQNAFTADESFDRASGSSEVFTEIESVFDEVLTAINEKKSEMKHSLWFDYIEIICVVLLFSLIFFSPVRRVIVEKEIEKVVEKTPVVQADPIIAKRKTTNKNIFIDVIRGRSRELMNLSCPLEIKGVRKLDLKSYNNDELKNGLNSVLDYLVTSHLGGRISAFLKFNQEDKGIKIFFENKSFCLLSPSKNSPVEQIKLDDGTIVGIRYELFIAKVKKKELVSLKKGKKKDLLKELVN